MHFRRLIDSTGRLVYSYIWKSIEVFSEGLAIVRDVNDQYGFIDKTCKLVIPCRWKSAKSFFNGTAMVADDRWKWWKIDRTGRVIGEVR